MFKNNDIIELDIIDFGKSGEGIGKFDGFAFFVEETLPGDKVEISITKLKKNYGFGKLLKIISPSKFRVEPMCKIADKCGGCSLQNFEYSKQLNFKNKIVKDCLERIGGFSDIKIPEIIGMENPYFYRNKAQFQVGEVNGKPVIGFYSMKSHNVIQADECCIQNPANKRILDILNDFIIEFKLSIYNEKTGKGLIKHIITKFAKKTDSIMVCIVINGENLPHHEILVEKLIQIKEISSICINVNKVDSSMILGDEVKSIYGNSYIFDYIGNIKFKISAKSFFQVNPIQTENLYNKILEFANLNGSETIIDAYCGIGSISLFLAAKAKKVYGVEIVEDAINDAIENSKINNIENIEFILGEAEFIIPKLYSEQKISADIVVVDPPRKGCDIALLETILQMNPKKVIYVSCDPSTLARDLKILCGDGYFIEKVQAVDMFPMTMHVETIVELQLIN